MSRRPFIPLLAIRELLTEWVDQHQGFINLQWAETKTPENMLRINLDDQITASHYFLIVASITESTLVSRAENSRYLVTYLHHKLGDDLFSSCEEEPLDKLLASYPSISILGSKKDEIPRVIIDVNNYVNQHAGGDLTTHYHQFNTPKEFVQDLEENIPRMAGFHVEKAWMYLRWLTRPQDLGVYSRFNPRDLMLPLTSYIREVFYRLGDCPEHEDWPPHRIIIEKTRERCTGYARELFPDDPTKVDYPFYLLGRWLKGKPYRRWVLYDSLMFFKEISRPDYYKVFEIDVSQETRSYVESRVKSELEANGIEYERYTFNLPHDCMAPRYTPDFILPDTLKKGRKIILEPHGVHWSSDEPSERTRFEIEFIDKLWNFRNEYGGEYYIILFVPEQHERYVDLRYWGLFDEIWSFQDIPRVIKTTRSA